MSYYFEFDGASYFDAGSPHNALGLTSYRLVITAAFNGTASGFYVIQGNNGNDRVRIRFDSFDFLEVRYTTASSRVRWQLSPSEYADNQPHEFEIIRNGDNHELFLDGVSQGVSASSVTASDTANFIGRANTTTTDAYSLYKYQAYDSSSGGSLIFDYGDKNASGTEMLNAVGTNAVLQGNQNWVFYSAPSAGVTAVITESTSDFSESSAASFTATLSAQVTEVNASFSESSSATITSNIVSVSVTETSQDFSESASASISGSLAAIVTELSQSFTESSTADISANISAVVTELAQDFNESAQVNLTSSFTVEVTETTSDFEEACYIQLPVQRLTPRKTISVSNRSGSTIRVRRRSSVIRVK